MNRRERRDADQDFQDASIGEGPNVTLSYTVNEPGVSDTAALYEAGLGHAQAGRFLDAQLCCQQVLALDPGHADVLHLMGLMSFQADEFDLAVEWIARAIRQNPRPEYLASLGS